MKQVSGFAILVAAFLLATNAVFAQTTLLFDDFSSSTLDETNKWTRGANSSSVVIPTGGVLQVHSINDQVGWIVTKESFIASNTTISAKIVKASAYGSIGVSLTKPDLDKDRGIYDEPYYYRFYIDTQNGSDQKPYRLYPYKKNGPLSEELPLTSPFTLSGSLGEEGSPFYIRLRFDSQNIYFEYSTNGTQWAPPIYQEPFNVLGYSLTDKTFYYEIAATDAPTFGTLKLDDFQIVCNNPSVCNNFTEKTILDDPLNSSNFVNLAENSDNPPINVTRYFDGNETNFSTSGWKPSGDADMVWYDLSHYLEKGSLEIDVTQFVPASQVSMPRHHVLAMFRMPWGGHHIVENLETIWDLHTGKLNIMPTQSGEFLPDKFNGGIKLYTHTYDYQDEKQTHVTASQSPWLGTQTYHLKFVWNDSKIRYFRDGVLQGDENGDNDGYVDHPLANEMGLRYLYVGRDRTVCSGDFVTGFMRNQYKTMQNASGPIYSNLLVKELVSSTDVTPPTIAHLVPIDEYANGARVYWGAGEREVACYVEYGTTSSNLDSRTQVLGPTLDISNEFSTLLSNLAPNTTYYYRVVGEDKAGNIGTSSIRSFTTFKGGLYIFQSMADTYIERNRTRIGGTDENPVYDYPWLYGNTRAHGNYGWMNLMTGLYRDCFLQFNVTGTVGNIWKATLRLHGRQTGNTGGKLKQFTPISTQNDWENNATWADATSSNPQYIDRISSNSYVNNPNTFGTINTITAEQWYSIDVSSATRDASNNYYFVLEGIGTPNFLNCGAFDSKESTNFQPELIVETKLFTQVSSIFSGVKNGASAWGDYDGDGDLDLLHTGETSTGVPLAKIYRNNNGAFDDIGATLIGVKNSAVAWGDYDMDNDLDILLTGSSTSGRVSKVYRNDSGNFTDISAPLVPVDNGAVAWGNYNNEHNLDILLSGQADTGPFTKIYRGILSGTNRTWMAMDIYALPPLTNSSVAWGDNNLDDYSDLLLAGTDAADNGVLTIFKNIKNPDGSRGFIAIAMSGLTVVPTTSCAWGNFDTDGDLDIALGGVINPSTGVYRRDQSNGSFELIDDASLLDLKDGAVAWADFDNDGDLDLLVTGQTNASNRHCRLYRHDVSSQKFVSVFDFEGVRYSSVAWGDYDGDGDLDVLFSGENGSSIPITRLYRNNSITPNTPPTVPTNLSDAYSETDETVTLTWDESTDSPKPQNVITYNVMIGASEGGFDIVSPMSRQDPDKRMIPEPGNASTNKTYIVSTRNGIGLAPGTYWWKVQAIDNLFAVSAFSVAKSFTVPVPKTAAGDSVADFTNTREAIPKEFALSPNYPNPFNPSTRLNLNLPENGRVVAVVYDLKGQEVVRLHDAEMTAGYKFLDWDGRNAVGSVAGNGVYFVKVIFAGESGARKESTSRVLLLK